MVFENTNPKLFHLGFDPVKYRAEYAIVPGDPDRVMKIAAFLDSYEPVAKKREYTTVLGELDGKKVFICSTGIGGPSAAIAVEELCRAGVKTFIRVGTCGGIHLSVDGGDAVIPTGAIRQEGTSHHYAPIEYPACADFEVITALQAAASEENIKAHIGVIQSKDSFYGQHSPEDSPVGKKLLDAWSAWKRLGVLASEMECATIFTVAAAKGVRAGAVLSALWNQERVAAGLPAKEHHDTETVIRVALSAIRKL